MARGKILAVAVFTVIIVSLLISLPYLGLDYEDCLVNPVLVADCWPWNFPLL